MNISENSKKLIIKEFDFVLGQIDTTDNLEEKFYYLSALHGMVQRIINIDFDPTLVFLHNILQAVHGSFSNRLAAMKKQADAPIILTDDIINKLFEKLDELSNCLKNDEDISKVLESLNVLVYVTTGNGFYLLQKGVITL